MLSSKIEIQAKQVDQIRVKDFIEPSSSERISSNTIVANQQQTNKP
jgi:hypothetical protein